MAHAYNCVDDEDELMLLADRITFNLLQNGNFVQFLANKISLSHPEYEHTSFETPAPFNEKLKSTANTTRMITEVKERRNRPSLLFSSDRKNGKKYFLVKKFRAMKGSWTELSVALCSLIDLFDIDQVTSVPCGDSTLDEDKWHKTSLAHRQTEAKIMYSIHRQILRTSDKILGVTQMQHDSKMELLELTSAAIRSVSRLISQLCVRLSGAHIYLLNSIAAFASGFSKILQELFSLVWLKVIENLEFFDVDADCDIVGLRLLELKERFDVSVLLPLIQAQEYHSSVVHRRLEVAMENAQLATVNNRNKKPCVQYYRSNVTKPKGYLLPLPLKAGRDSAAKRALAPKYPVGGANPRLNRKPKNYDDFVRNSLKPNKQHITNKQANWFVEVVSRLDKLETNMATNKDMSDKGSNGDRFSTQVSPRTIQRVQKISPEVSEKLKMAALQKAVSPTKIKELSKQGLSDELIEDILLELSSDISLACDEIVERIYQQEIGADI